MSDSYIRKFNGGMSFVGPDATSLVRAITLRNAIQMHMTCGLIPTRGVTITHMFQMVTEYTGQTYKANKRPADHARAIADLTVWIETMKSAIPMETDNV